MKSRITILLLLILGVTSGIHAQMFTANLNGSNQTQYVATMATGMIEAELEGDMLTVSGSFENLSSAVATEIAGGAHIHLGYAGQNGAVGIVLTASLDADMLGGTFVASQNMFDLTADQKDALLERGFYVNIHTANYQAGEIRGQLVPKSDQVFRVNLTGNNQVQPILTSATGAMIVELIGHNITISGSFSGLSSELATEIAGGGHLHMALAGQNGGVIKVLDITPDADLMGGIVEAENNKFELSHDELMALLGREIYVNIHSDNYPNGELRGQILLDSGVLFQSNLSGISQPSPVNTIASGAVVAELDGSNLIVTGSFGNLSSPVATEIAGGAHIHTALAGSEGGVILVLNVDLNDDEMGGVFMRSENTFELTDEQLDHLFNRGLYINIHTDNYNNGEIRGQLLPVAQAYFTAKLDGLNEVIDMMPLQAPSNGTVVGEWTGNMVTISGSFSGLSSPLATEIAGGAHLHTAMAGSNGAVAKVLTVDSSVDLMSGEFHASSNMFDLSDVELEAFGMGGVYVNIHSEEAPSGEIRGQLLRDLVFFPDAPMIESPGDGTTVDLGMDSGGSISVSWTTSMDAGMNEIVYLWEASLDEDFENTLVFLNTGSEAMFSINKAELDSIMSDAGVMSGGSVTLYHRAYASNGSVLAYGDAQTVTVTRAVSTSIDENGLDSPYTFALDQNYPNPFNPSTQIRFSVPEQGQVSLQIFDMTGRMVAELLNESMPAGVHTVQFDAQSVASGMYVYRLNAHGLSLTNKMTLIK